MEKNKSSVLCNCLFEEIANLKEENEKLKKELKDLKENYRIIYSVKDMYEQSLDLQKNQKLKLYEACDVFRERINKTIEDLYTLFGTDDEDINCVIRGLKGEE